MLINKVKEFLTDHKLADSNVLVAFSGGLDSLCLLHSLHTLSEELNITVSACHVNHQWRGEESLQDEYFTIEICRNLNIKLFVERLEQGLPKTEDVAREHRYKKLTKIAQLNNISSVITAHTKSDQVETVLYRIIKGTGSIGLSGIPSKRNLSDNIYVYRPFLSFYRKEIEEYANQNQLLAREDSSNKDIQYLRNRIRHRLIPELSNYNKNISESILRISAISAENEEIINYFLQDTFNSVFMNTTTLDIYGYLEIPDFIKSRIIMKLLELNSIKYDYKMIFRIMNDIKSTIPSYAGVYYSLIDNLFIFVNNKNIKITAKEDIATYNLSYPVNIPGQTRHEGLNLILRVSEIDSTSILISNYPASTSLTAYVDLSAISKNLVFRTRTSGDFIQPLGMSGKMKLKKYLINHHITKSDKDSIPMLAIDNEILWVAGVGLSDKIKVINFPTHTLEIIRG